MNIMEQTSQALLCVACIRLGYFTLPKIMDDKMYERIIVEQSRLERLFELYWVNNLKTVDEYYSELLVWIKTNLSDLKNPNMFLGEYICRERDSFRYGTITKVSGDADVE